MFRRHCRKLSPVPVWLHCVSHLSLTLIPQGTEAVSMSQDLEQNCSGRQPVSPSQPSNAASFHLKAPFREGLHCRSACGVESKMPLMFTSPVAFTPACARRLCLTEYPFFERAIQLPTEPIRIKQETHHKYPPATICRLDPTAANAGFAVDRRDAVSARSLALLIIPQCDVSHAAANVRAGDRASPAITSTSDRSSGKSKSTCCCLTAARSGVDLTQFAIE
mmetsp:Transcript_5435/g.10952  ORF Transcript_5435/g.10952 Transcript_5435/m.10952 type:complete len:221 (+) Transcript_5435:636-1298(+)